MIQKRKMTFTPLKEKDMALYVGPNHPYYEKEYVTKEELRNLRYVQHEEDQISLLHTSGHLQEDLIDSRDFQQIVTVNSSSLMRELLRKTDLANLSCNLQKEKERDSLIRMIPIPEFDIPVEIAAIVSLLYIAILLLNKRNDSHFTKLFREA